MGQKTLDYSLIEKCMIDLRNKVPIDVVCKNAGISESTFYAWKKEYQHLNSKQTEIHNQHKERIKELEREVQKLRRLYQPFNDLREKLKLKPEEKIGYANYLIEKYGFSVRLALEVIQLSRTAFKYDKLGRDDVAIYDRLEELEKKHPEGRFKQYFQIMKNEGREWNHKRVQRIYNNIGLHLRSRKK